MQNTFSILFWANQNKGLPVVGSATAQRLTYNFNARRWQTKKGIPDKPVEVHESPMICRVTLNGQRTNISTGCSLNPEQWDPNKKEMRGWSLQAQNIRQVKFEMENKIRNTFAGLEKGGSYVSIHQLIEALFPERARKEKQLPEKPADRSLRLNFVAESFLNKKASQVKKNTIKTMRSRIKSLIRVINQHWGENPVINKLNSKSFFIRFGAYLIEEKYKPRTINTMMDCMHDLLLYAEKIDDDFILTPKVEHVRVEKDVRFLKEKQISAFQSYHPTKIQLRVMKLIILFVLETGTSRADLEGLTDDNIIINKEGDSFLYFHREKTTCLSVIPISGHARDILSEMKPYVPRYHALRKTHDVSRHLIPVAKKDTVYAQLRKVSDAVGFKVTLHPMRHTFAMRQLNEEGRSIETVSRMLGHATVSTTENVYAQVTDVRVQKETSKFYNHNNLTHEQQNRKSQG